METLKKFLAISAISVLALTACTQGTENSEEATEEAAVVADAPEGCPDQTSLVVKTDEAGEVSFSHEQSWYTQWADTVEDGRLYFHNYTDFDPDNTFGHEKVEGDVLVYIDLGTKDDSPIGAGTWNYRNEEENNELTWINVSTIDLAGAIFDDNAKVELSYLGEDYVCGSITAEEDADNYLKGEFIAKFHRQGV